MTRDAWILAGLVFLFGCDLEPQDVAVAMVTEAGPVEDLPASALPSCASSLCIIERCGGLDDIWPDCRAGCGGDEAARVAAVYCILGSPLCDQMLAACEPIGKDHCQAEDFGCNGDLIEGCDPLTGDAHTTDCAASCGGTCTTADAEFLGAGEVLEGDVPTCLCPE